MLKDDLIMGIRNPYPLRMNQWHVKYRNEARLCFYEINTSPIETTTRCFTESKRLEDIITKNDFLCLTPIVTYKLAFKKDNLLIAANVLERTDHGIGFEDKFKYKSWRDWLGKSSWVNVWFNGLNVHGIAKYGKSMADHKYGYVFKDRSLLGSLEQICVLETTAGLSTLVGLWTAGLAEQIFFDKNGRPVALAVSDEENTIGGQGWMVDTVNREVF